MTEPLPTPAPDRSAEATLLLSRGQPSGVVALLAASGGPRTPSEHALYAEALHHTGRSDDAITAARRAVHVATAAHDGVAARVAAAVLALAMSRRSTPTDLAGARATLAPLMPRPGAKMAAEDARMLHADGVLRLRAGDLVGARISLLQALAGMRGAHDDWRAATVLDTLGNVHRRSGDAFRAQQAFQDSLALKAKCGDILGEAITCGSLGRLYLEVGEPARALEFFDANLARTLICGDRHGEVVARNGRGMALLELARFNEAELAIGEALKLADERGMPKQAGLCVKDLAVVAERQGRFDDALDFIRDATRRFADLQNAEALGFCALVEGRIYLRADLRDWAQSALATAVKSLRAVQRPDLLAEALLRLAEASLSTHADGATRWIAEAEALAGEHLLRGVLEDARSLRGRSAPAAAGRSVVLRNGLGLAGGGREFVLLDVLGGGAQGEAWRALDVRTGALAVLKRIRSSGAMSGKLSAVQRLQGEFEAAMRVDHPAVVRVLGFERTGDDFYLAMEMLEGPDLRTRLDAGVPPAATACAWMRRISEGLGALHSANVIHRDLKPANIVFSAPDAPVLIDFGLALLDEAHRPAAHEIAGTLIYMAPEQVLGQPMDHRADLFALGLVAAEICTGRNPVRDAIGSDRVTYGAVAVLLAQDAAVARIAASIVWPGEVPQAFREAVQRLLAHAPQDRFPSAAEFVGAAFCS